jgi:hypothetical protein
MEALLDSTSRPTTSSTASPSKRRPLQSTSHSAGPSLKRYQSFGILRSTHVESSAPTSPESSQYLSQKEHALPDASLLLNHSPLSTLSPLAHLGLVQSQRNALRSELNSQNTTNASQAESITSLRKLSLRLVVRMFVKNFHLQNDVQIISQLRMSEYLRSREYASAVEQLNKFINLHENVMNDLVNLVPIPEKGPPASKFCLFFFTEA